jgi:hypothetical protein
MPPSVLPLDSPNSAAHYRRATAAPTRRETGIAPSAQFRGCPVLPVNYRSILALCGDVHVSKGAGCWLLAVARQRGEPACGIAMIPAPLRYRSFLGHV